MKNIFILLILILSLTGCKPKYPPDYTYKWDVDVTYTNGDMETIHHEQNSSKGIPLYLYLRISETGSPCLCASNGYYTRYVIACGVRKYQILKEEKVGPLAPTTHTGGQ
jgi:hypothetical protein